MGGRLVKGSSSLEGTPLILILMEVQYSAEGKSPNDDSFFQTALLPGDWGPLHRRQQALSFGTNSIWARQKALALGQALLVKVSGIKFPVGDDLNLGNLPNGGRLWSSFSLSPITAPSQKESLDSLCQGIAKKAGDLADSSIHMSIHIHTYKQESRAGVHVSLSHRTKKIEKI